MLFKRFNGRHEIPSRPAHHGEDQIIDSTSVCVHVEMLQKMFYSPRVISRGSRGANVDGDLHPAVVSSRLCHGVAVQSNGRRPSGLPPAVMR